MQRDSDFTARRKKLAHLSDAELDKRFWELANQIVTPLVDMAREYTSPSIERSVLLRMGFSSLDANAIVKRIDELGLLGRGAGHVLWRLAQDNQSDIEEAGRLILTEAGAEQAQKTFVKGGATR